MEAATVKPSVMNRSAVKPTSMEECMGASVSRRRRVQVARQVGYRVPGEASAMKVTTLSAYIVAVNDISSVGNERMVIVRSPAMMPVASPMVPTPAKAGKRPNAESQSKTNPRTVKVKSGPRRPTGKHWHWIPVH
jgi:hypothetical protein